MAAITLLHTADWHLGKRLNQKFDLDEPHREALGRLLAIIDAERPDAVLLSGDVFDVPERPSLAALATWNWVSGEIAARGVPLIAIPGNHDHAVRLSLNAGLARASGLHLIHDLPDAERPLRIAGVEIFAIPFHKPPRARALAQTRHGEEAPEIGDFDYDAAMRYFVERALAASSDEAPRVLLAHAFVTGGASDPQEEGAGEESLSLGGAGAVAADTLAAFDYVALGHLHGAMPVGGHAHVRYAGSLYPCAFDERGAKSVTLVTFPDGARAGTRPSTRSVTLPASRQVRIVDDLDFETLLARGRAARAALDESVDDYLLARVTDVRPIPYAQATLTQVYPNGQFDQPNLRVMASDDEATAQARDAFRERVRDGSVGIEEMFAEHFARSFGGEGTMTDVERGLLREVIAAMTDQEREA
jgi:DNA repair protein SbcD/Mre11